MKVENPFSKELVSSQMESSISALSYNDSQSEAQSPLKSEFPDLDDGQPTIGEDGSKQYNNDNDNNAWKAPDSGIDSKSAKDLNEQDHIKDSFQDEYNDKININSSSALLNGSLSVEYQTPPTVVDDTLGNEQKRTTAYSTNPTYSLSSPADSSTWQMSFASANCDVSSRPDRLGFSTFKHSENSAGICMIDDLMNDSISYDRKSPVTETDVYVSPWSTPTTAAVLEPLDSYSSGSPNTNKLSISELIEDVFGGRRSPVRNQTQEDSPNRSQLHTPPTTSGQVGDGINLTERQSPVRKDIFSISLHMHNHSTGISPHDSGPRSHGSSSPRSNASSRDQTPQHELISSMLHSSPNKLHIAQEMKQSSEGNNGNPTGSRPVSLSNKQDYGINTWGSQNRSRPESLTSEQKPSQYYEHLLSEIDLKTSVNVNFPSNTANSGIADLPVIRSQHSGENKCNITPDNHFQVPMVPAVPFVTGSLLPNRSSSRTPMSSTSSGTVTPVMKDTALEANLREQIKDLENTVSNLRNLLTVSEQQVKDIERQLSYVNNMNKKLQLELENVQKQPSAGQQMLEMEKIYKDMSKEKELLNSEIMRLRVELLHSIEPSLNNHNPNNLTALQQKIDILNRHIQDLQEAKEDAVKEIHVAEKKVKKLEADNEALRIAQSERFKELEENRHLKAEILNLYESHACQTEAADYHHRIELQQLKDDRHSLQEKNYKLHDDNLKLKEELSNLRKSVEMVDALTKSSKDSKTLQMSDIFNTNVASITTPVKPVMPLYQADGDMSHTPTDIPLNSQTCGTIHSSSWNRRLQRLNSLGSDDSNSCLSDVDDLLLTAAARLGSKSAVSRGFLRKYWQNGGAEIGEKSMAKTLSHPPSAGMRSVTLKPLVTQCNKTGLSLSTSLYSLTHGLSPFVPRSCSDLHINDVVKFSRHGGKLSQGTIKFIGHLPGRGDIHLGIELDREEGKHNGVFEGNRYFKCKPNKGVFVAYHKVAMAWSSH